MIIKIKSSVVLLLVLVAVSGCSHVTTISTNISPTAIAAQRNDIKTAITFTPELLAASSKSLLDGTMHEYTFNGGDALKAALTRATEVVYTNVHYENTRSTKELYQRQITYGLNYFDMNISLSPGLFKSGVKATCNVSVSVEIYDGSGKLVSKQAASGNGISSHSTGSPDKAKDYFAEAAQKAIQQLADNVANILM